MQFEKLVFANIIHREDYARKVIPFLKEDYFSDNSDRLLFSLIDEYVQKYNNFPSQEALTIDLGSKTGIVQKLYE